ncbi:hypothetical protein [Aidingimonas lacisalsi]|uniref:hypothetical protein n=1 Tax=Aidingimonas lacisalsi TaxID=2604086 RepID=UPI001F29A17C|nr:hypothetical protein [Aidingimonas lacisalsi]
MSHTTTAPDETGSGAVTASPRGMITRWWLAGLLVGCLLPATLLHAEPGRAVERVTQICLLAPDVIRARSRHIAYRWRWYPRLSLPALPRINVVSWWPLRRLPSAAHDLLSCRGPPAWRVKTVRYP